MKYLFILLALFSTVAFGQVDKPIVCPDTDQGCVFYCNDGGTISACGSITKTGVRKVPEGNSNFPSLSFDNDADNGLYRHGPDRLGVTGLIYAHKGVATLVQTFSDTSSTTYAPIDKYPTYWFPSINTGQTITIDGIGATDTWDGDKVTFTCGLNGTLAFRHDQMAAGYRFFTSTKGTLTVTCPGSATFQRFNSSWRDIALRP